MIGVVLTYEAEAGKPAMLHIILLGSRCVLLTQFWSVLHWTHHRRMVPGSKRVLKNGLIAASKRTIESATVF